MIQSFVINQIISCLIIPFFLLLFTQYLVLLVELNKHFWRFKVIIW